MSTLELKRKKLHNHINEIQDEALLQKILKMVEEEEPLQLSDGQKAAILRGKEDVKTGRVLSHDEAEKELDKWLREKK